MYVPRCRSGFGISSILWAGEGWETLCHAHFKGNLPNGLGNVNNVPKVGTAGCLEGGSTLEEWAVGLPLLFDDAIWGFWFS